MAGILVKLVFVLFLFLFWFFFVCLLFFKKNKRNSRMQIMGGIGFYADVRTFDDAVH